MLQKLISFICCRDFCRLWKLETAITKLIYTCMLWFNFILALNFILHCFNFIMMQSFSYPNTTYTCISGILKWNQHKKLNNKQKLKVVICLSIFTVHLNLTPKCTYLHVFQVWQIKPVIRDPVNVIFSQNTANHNT